MVVAPRSWRLRHVAAPACALVLAACGSTVQYAGSVPASQGLGAPGSTHGGTGGSAVLPGGAPATVAPGVSAGATSTTGGLGPSGSGGATGGEGTTGIHVGRKDPLPVGVIIANAQDAAKGASLVGVDLDIGDNRAQAQSTIDYLNSKGGILGRRIQPYFHTLKASPLSPAEAQQICDEFTSDHKMAAVISTNRDIPALIQCLAHRGVAYINDYITSISAKVMRDTGGLAFAPGSLVLDRAGLAMVEGLYRQGFLTNQVVGIIHYDEKESNDVVDKIMVPRLKALGIKRVVTNASSPADGSTYNQANAVLAFRREGVTRVLAFADNPIFFMNAAKSQQYKPEYGLDSNVSPGGFLQQQAPKDQLANAHAVGVLPASDVDSANDPGPVSTRQTLCLKIMRDSQQPSKGRLAQEYMGWYCDALFFLKDAMVAAGSTAPADLARGARALGTSYHSTVTFSSDLRTRPDGASGYRDVLYMTECSCFRYSGPLRALP